MTRPRRVRERTLRSRKRRSTKLLAVKKLDEPTRQMLKDQRERIFDKLDDPTGTDEPVYNSIDAQDGISDLRAALKAC